MTTALLDPPRPAPVDDGTRREFIAGGLAAGLILAGCGEDEQNANGGDTRTVRHAAGTTEVPGRPTQIVASGDNSIVVGVIALGVTPAGAASDIEDDLAPLTEVLPPDLDPQAIEPIGEPLEPELEAIAAIAPQMIVGDDNLEGVYRELSQIAPTVLVVRGTNGEWRQRFRALAEAIGRQERAASVEADYERMLSRLPDLAGVTVAFLRKEEGSFRIEGGATAFPGSVARDAGISTLDARGVGTFSEEAGFVELSDERLGVVAEADVIVVGDRSDEAPAVEQFEANPLWGRLPAVRRDRVLSVPQSVYNLGSYYSATLLVRELVGVLR